MRRSRSGVLVAVLVLVSLTLVTLDAGLGGSGLVDRLRAGTASMTGFLHRTGATLFRPDTEVRRMDERNARLRMENALLRSELAEAPPDTLEQSGVRLISANVIGYGPAHAYAHTIALDAGTADGVAADSAVLVADGPEPALVGRVLRAERTTSTVLLLCDAESTVGARLSESRELALLDGSGGCGDADTSTLRVLDLATEVRSGERVVSFGSPGGRPYVPDIPIGRVEGRTLGTDGAVRLAEVRPAVDFTALDQVSVVVESD